MSNIVIGIEGLVGSGKTSICRELLNYIPNSIILHGGNLYRGIVYALMSNSNKIDLAHLKSNIQNADIKNIMDKYKIRLNQQAFREIDESSKTVHVVTVQYQGRNV